MNDRTMSLGSEDGGGDNVLKVKCEKCVHFALVPGAKSADFGLCTAGLWDSLTAQRGEREHSCEDFSKKH